MLDALLETIGTLGILASLAAKFGKPSADAMACDAAGRDRLHATVSAFPSMHSDRSHRRIRRRVRKAPWWQV
jgi:hypothetical protein